MPPLTPTMPKTHSVVVDLNQIIVNIQRAATYVSGVRESTHQRPENPSPSGQNKCHIDTLGELRVFLQPALESPWVQYSKKSYKEKWVHILEYEGNPQDRHHILLMPTTIRNTLSNTQCSIEPGLTHYFGAALDITPPTTATTPEEAAMMGYIRCFGAGNLDCPNYRDYAPPIAAAPPSPKAVDAPVPKTTVTTPAVVVKQPVEPPNIQGLLKYYRLRRSSSHATVNFLYAAKSFGYALNLARDLHWNVRLDAAPAEQMADLMIRHTPQLSRNDEKTPEEESSRINRELEQFLNALFQTAAWQSQYRRFRKDFLEWGCTESKNAATGICHVACPAIEVQFDVHKTNVRDLASKTITK